MRKAQQKRVRVFGHGVLHAGPQYKTAWEDVWLWWKGKPGRRTYRLGPCVSSKADILGQIDSSREFIAKFPDTPHMKTFVEEIQEGEEILRQLEASPDGLWEDGRVGIPNVYTTKMWLDRAEVNRMLTWLLARRYGITNPPKFVWEPCDFIIQGVSFGADAYWEPE